jgi:hypothetical protein
LVQDLITLWYEKSVHHSCHVVIGFLYTIAQCRNRQFDTQRIKAKVIRITCATTVIQVLDPAHYNLGETWTIEGTSNTYEHVAVVSNKCEFPSSLKDGDEFYFKQISENDASNDCAVCMMYDFPPSKGIYLRVVN